MSNVIVQVSDTDRSIDFYEGVLGLSVQGRAGDFVFLDAGAVTLVLAPAEGAVDPGDTEIVLEVSDIDEAYARLAAEVEFRIAPRPVSQAGDRVLHAADFRDPDGHILSITGWKA